MIEEKTIEITIEPKKHDYTTLPGFYVKHLKQGRTLKHIGELVLKEYVTPRDEDDLKMIKFAKKRAIEIMAKKNSDEEKDLIEMEIVGENLEKLYLNGQIFLDEAIFTTLRRYLLGINVQINQLAPRTRSKYTKTLAKNIKLLKNKVKDGEIPEIKPKKNIDLLSFNEYLNNLQGVSMAKGGEIIEDFLKEGGSCKNELSMSLLMRYFKVITEHVTKLTEEKSMFNDDGSEPTRIPFIDYYGKENRYTKPSDWISYRTFYRNPDPNPKLLFEIVRVANSKDPRFGLPRRINGVNVRDPITKESKLTRKNRYRWLFNLKPNVVITEDFDFAFEINKVFIHHLLNLRTFDVVRDGVDLQVLSIFEAACIVQFKHRRSTSKYKPNRSVSISPAYHQFEMTMNNTIVNRADNFGSENKLNLDVFEPMFDHFDIVIYFISDKNKKRFEKTGGNGTLDKRGYTTICNRQVKNVGSYLGNNCLVSCILHKKNMTENLNYTSEKMKKLYKWGNNGRKLEGPTRYEQLPWFEEHFKVNIYVYQGTPRQHQKKYNLCRTYISEKPCEGRLDITLLLNAGHYYIIIDNLDLIENIDSYRFCWQHCKQKNIDKQLRFKIEKNYKDNDLVAVLDYETIFLKCSHDIFEISCSITLISMLDFLNFDYKQKEVFYKKHSKFFYSLDKYTKQEDIDYYKHNVSRQVYKWLTMITLDVPKCHCYIVGYNSARFDNILLAGFLDYEQIDFNPMLVANSILDMTFEINKVSFSCLDVYRFTPGLSLNKACKDFNTCPVKKEDYKGELLNLNKIYNNSENGLITYMSLPSKEDASKTNLEIFREYNDGDIFSTLDLCKKLQYNFLKYYGKNIFNPKWCTIQSLTWPLLVRSCYDDEGNCITKFPMARNRAEFDFHRKGSPAGRCQPFLGKQFFKYPSVKGMVDDYENGKTKFAQKLFSILDAKSLYPFVMLSCPFPVGLAYFEADGKNNYYPMRCSVFWCTIIHQNLRWKHEKMESDVPDSYFLDVDNGYKPIFPQINDLLVGNRHSYPEFGINNKYAPPFSPVITENKSYDWTFRGKISRVLTNVAINEIRRRGGEVQVHYGFVWKESKHDIFKKYLDTPRKRKMFLDELSDCYNKLEPHFDEFKLGKFDNIDLDNDFCADILQQCLFWDIWGPNSALRNLEKAIMNILSGAVIMKYYDTNYCYANTNEKLMKFSNEHGAPIDISQYPFVSGGNLKNFNINTARPVIWGIFIYTYSHLWMYETLWGSYNGTYTATDSCSMFYEDSQHFQNTFPHMMTKSVFGKFEEQTKGNEMIIIRNHLYAIFDTTDLDKKNHSVSVAKIGGIKGSTARVYFDGYQFRAPDKIRSMLKPFTKHCKKPVGEYFIQQHGKDKGEFVFKVTYKMFKMLMEDEPIFFKSFEMNRTTKKGFNITGGNVTTCFNSEAKKINEQNWNQCVTIIRSINRTLIKSIIAFLLSKSKGNFDVLEHLNNDNFLINFLATWLNTKTIINLYQCYKDSTCKGLICTIVSNKDSVGKKKRPELKKYHPNLMINFPDVDYLTKETFNNNINKNYIKKVNVRHIKNVILHNLRTTKLPATIINNVMGLIDVGYTKPNKAYTCDVPLIDTPRSLGVKVDATGYLKPSFDITKRHKNIDYTPPMIY